MILGMTGSFGAGKGAVVDYLISEKGFSHYSASGFIAEETVRRGLPRNRDALTAVANDLRAKHGPTFIVDSLYESAKAIGGNAVIESLRAIAEVNRVKELGGVVIGIDADPALRYARAYSRGSEKDDVTFEKWLEQEKSESNPDNPAKGDIFGALKLSDYVIQNDGTLDELHAKIDAVLKLIRS